MRRSTIVLLIIVALLAGLYWYMQQPDNVIKKALTTEPTPTYSILGYIVGPVKGPVSRISIQSSEGKNVTLESKNGVWFVTTDKEVPADQSAAEAAATNVQTMQLMAKLNPAPDASATGLEKPAYTVSLVVVDGAPMTFYIGNATVTGSGYYIKEEDGSVVIVSKNSIDELTGLLSTPPLMYTVTPSPATETPTPEPTIEASATVTKTP